jgi:DNA-binding transcriptional ArsR family regulator
MSSTTPPKPSGHAAVADVAKALGHEHRIQLLALIAQGPRSVEQLAHACDLTIANTSRHLQQLRRVGLARGQRRGKQVFYALEPDAEVMAILRALGRIVEGQAIAMRHVPGKVVGERGAGIVRQIEG